MLHGWRQVGGHCWRYILGRGGAACPRGTVYGPLQVVGYVGQRGGVAQGVLYGGEVLFGRHAVGGDEGLQQSGVVAGDLPEQPCHAEDLMVAPALHGRTATDGVLQFLCDVLQGYALVSGARGVGITR